MQLAIYKKVWTFFQLSASKQNHIPLRNGTLNIPEKVITSKLNLN